MNNSRYRPALRLRQQTPQSPIVVQNKKIETYKLTFEALKHVTTLSSGSILLLITLFEKVFKTAPLKIHVLFSFGGFFASIFFSVVAMVLIAINAADGEFSEREKEVYAWSATLGLISFLFAIIFTGWASLHQLI